MPARSIFPTIMILFVMACQTPDKGDAGAVESTLAGANYTYKPEADPGKEPNPFGRYRDSVGRKDSLRTVFSARYVFRAFGEQPLGDRPTGDTRIRILCSGLGVPDFMLIMDAEELVLKLTAVGVPYAEYKQDPRRLSEEDAFLFRVLSRYYPIEDTSRSLERRKSLDSLARIHPELRSPEYYMGLMDRAVDPDSLKFGYVEYRVPSSLERLRSYMKKLDAAGFWSLPVELVPDDLPMDAGGYLLEVHTPGHYKKIGVTECPGEARELSKVCEQMVDLVWRGEKKFRLCD